MGTLFILNCIILSIFSIWYLKKVCNPLSNYSIGFILASIFFIQESYLGNLFKEKGFFFLMIGTLIFIGSFLFILFFKKRIKIRYVYNLKTVNLLINLTIFLSIFLLFLSLYEVLNFSGNIKNILFNSSSIRNQYLSREGNFLISFFGSISNMTILILSCLFPIGYSNKLKNINIKFVLVILLRLFLSIVTMSKESFLIFLIIILVSFTENISKRSLEIRFLIKKGIYFIGVVVILLLVIALQRSYIGIRYSSYTEAVLKTIGKYLYLPLEAFSRLIEITNNLEETKGIYSFRPIFNILSYLGIAERVSIIQNAVALNSANVYTMFGTMYRDFKEVGIILISILYGIFCGSLYSKYNQRKLSKVYINSLVGMVLFFSYYDFKFIQTVYIISIFYAIILEKVLFSKLYVTKKFMK